jgi:hypothetical protein
LCAIIWRREQWAQARRPQVAQAAALAARFATPVAALTAAPEVPDALSERALSVAEQAEVLAAFQTA